VQILPSGLRSRVKDLQLAGASLPIAVSEQSVTLVLEDDVDLSRGDLVVKAGEGPEPTRKIDAHVCWLGEAPLSPSRRYVLRHTTREIRAAVAEIGYRVDLNALAQVPATGLAMNDIGRVSFRLAQPIAADPYTASRATGAFIVIDEATNDTVGAGMIL
jgi:sulfate adenylyltransferase subunit 1